MPYMTPRSPARAPSSLLLVLSLAACGGGTAAVVGNQGRGSSGPPAIVAGLFTEGSRWQFPSETVTGGTDDAGQPTTEKSTGTETCRVEGARAIPGGWRTSVVCEGIGETIALVATPDGVWLATEGAGDDVTKLEPKKRLLAAQPVAHATEIPLDVEMGHSEYYSAKPHAGGWCFSHGIVAGDEGGWVLCVKDGALVGGQTYFGGGMTKDTYFGSVPRS